MIDETDLCNAYKYGFKIQLLCKKKNKNIHGCKIHWCISDFTRKQANAIHIFKLIFYDEFQLHFPRKTGTAAAIKQRGKKHVVHKIKLLFLSKHPKPTVQMSIISLLSGSHMLCEGKFRQANENRLHSLCWW